MNLALGKGFGFRGKERASAWDRGSNFRLPDADLRILRLWDCSKPGTPNPETREP